MYYPNALQENCTPGENESSKVLLYVRNMCAFVVIVSDGTGSGVGHFQHRWKKTRGVKGRRCVFVVCS